MRIGFLESKPLTTYFKRTVINFLGNNRPPTCSITPTALNFPLKGEESLPTKTNCTLFHQSKPPFRKDRRLQMPVPNITFVIGHINVGKRI
jgi:hypothetical protein